MSARDDLLKFCKDLADPDWCLSVPSTVKVAIAKMVALVEAETPRTITATADLDALPVGSVVKDEDGHAHLKYPRGWVRTGQEPYSTPEGILPAIVIHEATQ